jgi:hypothetical protein
MFITGLPLLPGEMEASAIFFHEGTHNALRDKVLITIWATYDENVLSLFYRIGSEFKWIGSPSIRKCNLKLDKIAFFASTDNPLNREQRAI